MEPGFGDTGEFALLALRHRNHVLLCRLWSAQLAVHLIPFFRIRRFRQLNDLLGGDAMQLHEVTVRLHDHAGIFKLVMIHDLLQVRREIQCGHCLSQQAPTKIDGFMRVDGA